MEEKARPNDEWNGWRKKETQAISLKSSANLVNEISFVNNYSNAGCSSRKK